MIENTIFDHVKSTGLIVGVMTEQEYIAAVKELADNDIDGSNVRQARTFASQLYRYCLREGKQCEPLQRRDFGAVLEVCV